jgi:ribose 5-phosphate isomerase B
MNFATICTGARMFPKTVIACDHAAYRLKEEIKGILESLGVPYQDLGTDSEASVDYPDFAQKVAVAVQQGEPCGILCCGTGIGMSIAANKFSGIRAALCNDVYTARMSREHNDANVLVLGGRTLRDSSELRAIIQTWLQTDFSGGRHQARLDKIRAFEQHGIPLRVKS